MGLFKRRRERESAIPPGTLENGSIATAPEQAPVATTEPTPPEPAEPKLATAPAPPPGRRTIADEVSAAAGGDLAAHVERLRALMAEHKVDYDNQPVEVRKAVVRDLNRRGVPAKVDEPLAVTDIGQVQAIASVLQKHGLLPEDADVASV